MTNERNVRTLGLGNLSKGEQQELKRLLRKLNQDFREVDEGDEIVLLKISATGVIPDVVKLLTAKGIDIIGL